MAAIEWLLLVAGGLLLISVLAGKRIIGLHLPPQVLIVLVARAGEHIVRTGSTDRQSGDQILVATNEASDLDQVKGLLAGSSPTL